MCNVFSLFRCYRPHQYSPKKYHSTGTKGQELVEDIWEEDSQAYATAPVANFHT